MINCMHPTAFTPDLTEGTWTARQGGFLPNAVAMETLDLCKLGHLEDGGPVELGDEMAGLARRFVHVNVLGRVLRDGRAAYW
jgi:homocysteine S-methyltransferase